MNNYWETSVNKELLLLRHGKSDWNTDTSDFNRPLNKRGKRATLQIGKWLAEQKLAPDLIISSPAIRALTTAEIVCSAMNLSEDTIQTDNIIYQASLSDLRQVLLHIPASVQRLLLVGHNPGFESLLSYLAPNTPIPEDGNLMPTATLAYLQLDPQWSFLQGSYLIQRAKDLPQLDE
ncbi:phosphohistidine phosphatase [Methylococcaceae bacterium CS1]|nr:histidine phosphatase family protein [Methyloprofundus sp.]TXK95446.1 phosphohistidine phosphatase [Methylococcaceae bacterium CS4]TXK99823.1 phosphohistidine phosphatase [Methylococcaceae bacterium CS5]TXL06449.1 phosphohistidine phosphatase [Methylococcaceae bacterium CS1]TXL07209.1 phosphohistidine phosphatase [Methylococcaceae bacterium CS3]TXL10885.1 phosphohistidine phosphatase [Methylococcaceae bacterium CS2]